MGDDSFLLLDIDEAERIDAGDNTDPPFVFGMTFTDPDLAEFSTFALVAPELANVVLAAMAASGMLFFRRRMIA